MEVRDRVDLGDGHLIEIGDATWDASQTSIRNRCPTSTGGFSPRSSSEIPIGDIEPLAIALANRDLLDISTCARILEALASSIVRRIQN